MTPLASFSAGRCPLEVEQLLPQAGRRDALTAFALEPGRDIGSDSEAQVEGARGQQRVTFAGDRCTSSF